MDLIVCSANPDDIKFAEVVSEALDFKLIVEPKIVTAIQFSNSRPEVAAFFLNVENIFQLRQHAGLLSSVVTGKTHIFLSTSAIEICEYIFKSSIAGNIVFQKYDEIEIEALRYAQVIQSSLKGTSPDLQNLLQKSNVKTIELRQLSEKSFLADTVSYFLQNNQCSERVSQSISSAADELLLNAIVDLGMVAADAVSGSGMILAKQPVFLQLASQGDYLAVGVTAMLNTTSKEVIYKNISQAFGFLKVGKANPDQSGFAFSLSLIVRTGASIRFFSSPGAYFAVAILFRRSQTILDLRSQFQYISTTFKDS